LAVTRLEGGGGGGGGGGGVYVGGGAGGGGAVGAGKTVTEALPNLVGSDTDVAKT